MSSIVATFNALRDQLFRYYDTPFGLADAGLEGERRWRLDRDGVTYREPWVEPIPSFVSSPRTVERSLAAAGLDADGAAFVRHGLVPSDIPKLYEHQERALLAARQGKNVVLTAGTGSGKTEALFLPIIAALLEESAAWEGSGAHSSSWWEGKSKPFAPQRAGESGRAAAVRALVLYPMNALVEDQLVRLRRALDSDGVRAWLADHRRGHRFYFGRYTGQTPISGAIGEHTRTGILREHLQSADQLARRARAQDAEAGRQDKAFYVPQLDGAEMRSRWDMISHPPDVLITNYSMLNVSLMRGLESPMWDQTADWISESPDHVFHLVVDELHMYRGTAGSEVAYLIRNLLSRLGLKQRPEQLRVLAASASFNDSSNYLEEFFSLPRSTFAVERGAASPLPKTEPGSLDIHAVAFAAHADETSAELASLYEDAGAASVLRSVLATEAGPRARSLSSLASSLFPGAAADTAVAATTGLLRAAEAIGEPRLRAHLFFRNISGIWACSNPTCEEVPEEFRSDDRSVGRLFVQPAYRCDCGSRVLELMYCQHCGDAFLGGYTDGDALQGWYLVPADPDIAHVPDQRPKRRMADVHMVYWPRLRDVTNDSWTREGHTFGFRRSRYDPRQGLLVNDAFTATGWSFHVEGEQDARLPSAPIQCPNCGDDWEKFKSGPRSRPITDPRRTQSPVRALATSFSKLNQVLGDELLSQLGEDSKLVAFSDSRQDAAILAIDLETSHHQDLVRWLLNTVAGEDQHSLLLDARSYVSTKDDRYRPSYDELRRIAPELQRLLVEEVSGLLTPDAKRELDERTAALSAGERPLTDVVRILRGRLLALGVNPAGPAASFQDAAELPWSTLVDFRASPPRLKEALVTHLWVPELHGCR